MDLQHLLPQTKSWAALTLFTTIPDLRRASSRTSITGGHKHRNRHWGRVPEKKTFFRTKPKLPLPPLPPPNSGTLVNFFKHQKHWSKWPSLPSIPQRPMPKCAGWLYKMGFSSTVQFWSSSWSGSSVTRSTPGSLPSWFPSTRTRNLAFTPQR